MTPAFQSARFASEIPESPGIYAFNISIVGPYRFGLRSGQAVSAEDRARIASALALRLSKIRRLFRAVGLTGQLVESNKSGLLRRVFDVAADESTEDVNHHEFEALSTDALNKILAVGSKATLMLPPIYVGMTLDQTLRQRYHQHRMSFSGADNLFGPRLRALGFIWDDLVYSYLPLAADESESLPLRFIERQIHAINPPPLSNR